MGTTQKSKIPKALLWGCTLLREWGRRRPWKPCSPEAFSGKVSFLGIAGGRGLGAPGWGLKVAGRWLGF